MDREPANSDDEETLAGRRPRPERRRGKVHQSLHRHPLSSVFTKIVVTGVGVFVLVAGLIMLVTPGPGLVGIVVGLAILATEWEWAESLLHTARRKLDEARQAAARVDPAVRRRRMLNGAIATAALLAVLVVAVGLLGWPGFVVDGWGWLQSLAGWIPDLPGM